MEANTIGIWIALAAFIIGLLIHMKNYIEWATKITIKLDDCQKSITQILLDIKDKATLAEVKQEAKDAAWTLVANTYVLKEDYKRHQEASKEHLKRMEDYYAKMQDQLNRLSLQQRTD